jgi:hypothetical protein
MPRKQRFKPSRKPKPIEPIEAVEVQRNEQDPKNGNGAEATDIETDRSARSPVDVPSVIEDDSSRA